MYLKKLEINGFKSFGKKTTLEFNSPVSVIVGPNGSGKSNIAEAMRFVLGEQSIKSMRGKKGEDLIFNGSSSVPRSGMASVSIFFDNSKRKFNIDYDEVIIKRVVHRDGINQYFINKSQVRLRDVIELLASVHIGASSHHIISQGQADKILNASIKDRRVMIEDALGLRIYHYKKEESERKLSKTDENIKEVDLLRREIAPHLKFLRKQVEKVKQAEDMRGQLRGLYLTYFADEEIYLKYTKDKIIKDKQDPLKEFQELVDKIDQSKNKIEKVESISGGSSQLNEIIDVEKRLQEIRVKKSELSRALGKLEGVMEYQRKTSESEVELSGDSIKKIDLNLIKSLDQKIDGYIKEALSSSDINFIKQVFEKINREIKNLISFHDKEVLSDLPTKNTNELVDMNKQKDSFEKEIIEIDKQESDLNNLYIEVREKIESKKNELRTVERDMFEMMSRKSEIGSILSSLNNKEESLALEELEFRRDLLEARVIAGREAIDYQKNLGILKSRDIQRESKRKIEKLKIKIEEYGAGGGEDVLHEYEDVFKRDKFLERELEDLDKSAESLRDLIKELTKKLDFEFKEGVKKVNEQFQEFFSLLFGGGHATLAVVAQKKKHKIDSDLNIDDMEDLEQSEVLEEGIDIEISVPNKKLKGLMMLSGGERALTSISLLFAVSQVNPPPFMVLDEMDSALDEANSKKYGDMIDRLSKYSQLIVVTHKRDTMSRAGVLYGVTMGADAISRLLSIKFDDVKAIAG